MQSHGRIQNLINFADRKNNFEMIVMLGVVVITLPMILLRKQIGRIEGFILFSIYVSYTTYLVYGAVQASPL